MPLLKETFSEWSRDKAPRLGASLAYYTIFSIAPLVLIAITIAGLVFDNAQVQIVGQVKGPVGDKGGGAIESMIKAAQKPVQTSIATVLAFGTLLFGAAGVFIQLKDALNTIWKAPESNAGGVWGFIKKYFLSFSMVLGIGFLLLVSLVLEAALAIAGHFLENRVPGMSIVMPAAGFILSFATVSLLFAMLFKFLPDAKVAWRDVWIGAFLTAGLFVVGKLGLGIYLGTAGVASAYGAAGSLVLILLWVYYSAQILFFGAEFTQVYSKRHGSRCDQPNTEKPPTNRKQRLVARIEQERKQMAKISSALGFASPVEKTEEK
ncbi:MAG: YihY/virulence factor BrkB family protein [Verrucomicrobiota bacterium]|nr:YihY/virulence factor BrkB family protein [Verrucomicrobiota bacterium]